MPTRRIAIALFGGVFILTPLPAMSATPPLSYLESFGARADPVRALTWALLTISIIVVIVIAALVLWGCFRRRSDNTPGVSRQGNGLQIIAVGMVLTIITLLGSVAWTMVVLAKVARPPSEPKVTLNIEGRQWWWAVRYMSDTPGRNFVTANEIHIPVGEPIGIRLRSNDVIHSFWVPALSGKTDVVPGQVNASWIEAGKPGIYLGQCAEFCGTEHARMSLRVVAEPRKAFEAWLDKQVAPAKGPQDENTVAGLDVFAHRCAACHAVRGTLAGGAYGPDLSHLAERATLAAGTVPNTAGYLSAWIADPQHIKPGTRMPTVPLTGSELEHVRAYLATLH